MERLQKVIANSGFISRRKAEELIKEGKVKVNGKVIKELGTKVSYDDSIIIDGVLLKKEENKEYYLLNKPRGVISSVSDDKNRKTVVDLIETETRIYPIGRLDYDTTGLILLTNDGEYTIFEFNNEKIKFVTSKRLQKYTKIVEWNAGYLVVMAKYNGLEEVEEYIDLIPILDDLYYDADEFLKPIKEVRIDYAV